MIFSNLKTRKSRARRPRRPMRAPTRASRAERVRVKDSPVSSSLLSPKIISAIQGMSCAQVYGPQHELEAGAETEAGA